MGSNGRGKDGEGTSGVKKDEESYDKYEPDVRFLAPEQRLHSNVNTNGPTDPYVQLPPHGHRPYHPPSPLGIQQVPVAANAMQRPRVVAQPQPRALLQLQDGYVESVLHERLKRVKITWNHSGTDVTIVGSWDNWENRETLQSVGQTFVIVKTLPTGIYHYRFIVDGCLTYAPEFPSACDDAGYAYNILDLQDYIPESLARLPAAEDPPSPPWSYDNIFLNEDEFSKPPPELPPQLPVTIRDEPSSSTGDSGLLPRPSHLELNHLYIHKIDGNEFVALRSTHKFEHKYVTMLLYKCLRRE